MNILTFDIEEWVLEKDHFGDRKEKYTEFDRILDQILDLLDKTNQSATFFCLGKIASDFPEVIKKIQSHGHEIGSHSNVHKWINKMTPEEFREDTRRTVHNIEDLIGRKVKSFRAPAFSIGESNKWAFEILYEFGIENDTSIFPGIRDFGGFPNFSEQEPCIIKYNGVQINEFPIPLYTMPIIHKRMAYSGGGYFRLLPLSFVRKRMELSKYNMCYFHIADLLIDKDPFMSRSEFENYFKESGTLPKRLSRFFKANIGRSKALKNLDWLIRSLSFSSIEDSLKTNSLNKTITI